MAVNFNRLPVGLLGFLDQKALGKYPAYLAEFTQPILDLAPFWTTNAQIAVGTASMAAPWLGFQAATVGSLFDLGNGPPEGYGWYVHRASVQMTIASTGVGSAQVGVRDVGLAATILMSDGGPVVTGAAGGSALSTGASQRPFIVRPGQLLVASGFQTTAAISSSVVISAIYTAFPL